MTEYFLSFWTFFALSNLWQPEAPKIKFWKTEKKPWRYYNFTHVHHKWQTYNLWLSGYEVRRTKLFVILEHFWHSYAQTTQKSKIWKKLKKPREIIILYMRTKNDSHMTYDSCDMERDGLIFLSFWTIFCSFTIQKIKIFRK